MELSTGNGRPRQYDFTDAMQNAYESMNSSRPTRMENAAFSNERVTNALQNSKAAATSPVIPRKRKAPPCPNEEDVETEASPVTSADDTTMDTVKHVVRDWMAKHSAKHAHVALSVVKDAFFNQELASKFKSEGCEAWEEFLTQYLSENGEPHFKEAKDPIGDFKGTLEKMRSRHFKALVTVPLMVKTFRGEESCPERHDAAHAKMAEKLNEYALKQAIHQNHNYQDRVAIDPRERLCPPGWIYQEKPPTRSSRKTNTAGKPEKQTKADISRATTLIKATELQTRLGGGGENLDPSTAALSWALRHFILDRSGGECKELVYGARIGERMVFKDERSGNLFKVVEDEGIVFENEA